MLLETDMKKRSLACAAELEQRVPVPWRWGLSSTAKLHTEKLASDSTNSDERIGWGLIID